MAGTKIKIRTCRGSAQWARMCYGLDLCGDRPVAVRAVRSRAGLDFTTLASGDRSFSDPGAVSAACLSERESFSRWLTAPFASRSKAAQVYPSLLDIQLPFPVESCLCEFLPSGRSEPGTVRTLAVAARQTDVEKKLEACKAAGVDPMVLDQEGLALWTQTVSEAPPVAGAVRVVVSLYGTRAVLVIGRDGEIMSSHCVRQRAEEFNRILCAALNGPPPALEWAWAGPDAATAGVVDALYTAVSVRWPGRTFTHTDPGTFLARALATRALLPGPFRCNLRAGEYRHPVLTARAEKAARNTAMTLVAGGLIVVALAIGMDLFGNRMIERVKTEFTKRVDALAGDHVTARGDDAIAAVDQAMQKGQGKSRPFAEAFAPSLAGHLKAIVISGKSYGMTFSRVELRRNSVTVTGTAKTWDNCEKMAGILASMGYPAKAFKESTAADGRIRFKITTGDRR